MAVLGGWAVFYGPGNPVHGRVELGELALGRAKSEHTRQSRPNSGPRSSASAAAAAPLQLTDSHTVCTSTRSSGLFCEDVERFAHSRAGLEAHLDAHHPLQGFLAHQKTPPPLGPP
jgi:hypothetical protein